MCTSSLSSACEHRPHDLLWVDDASAVVPVDALPLWATTAWLAVAPLVVRRAPRLRDRVPIGLRGAARNERCAAWVARDRVIRESGLPCLRALARLACELDESSLAWGVTGSVGFTLASGFDVLRAGSDLDLLVRSPDSGNAAALRALRRSTSDAESRIDVQVETPCGAFALKEWLRTGGPVLLKTADGPSLCDDPWDAGRLNATPPGRHVMA